MTRPAPYNPAHRCVHWWWTWAGLWKPVHRYRWNFYEERIERVPASMGWTRYATWPQARAYRRRAKKAKRKI